MGTPATGKQAWVRHVQFLETQLAASFAGSVDEAGLVARGSDLASEVSTKGAVEISEEGTINRGRAGLGAPRPRYSTYRPSAEGSLAGCGTGPAFWPRW